ncbi:hypothetical protein [Demequina sp.]|uniref:hypothetical protein n=1 Tax=Demequina sp. TaxID=2050685 RepID=UPI0025BB6AF9|nr:hypothetical protein [Demequina sp.]
MFLRRATNRDDAGMALVMVLGMMLLMGIVLVTLVSAAVFGISFTTQTRASVQSVAAAEAGIDFAGAAVMNEDCATATSSGVFDMTGATPAFEGVVYTKADATSAYVAGCPDPDDYAFKIVSTGYAEKSGINGKDTGDIETLEAEWIKHESAPLFEDAVRGDVYVGSAGIAGILAADDDANVFTVGDFYCPSGVTIEGSLVVAGDAKWTQSTCRVTGDVYVGGNLTYPVSPGAQPNVGGDLYVVGNVRSGDWQDYGDFGMSNDNQYINVAGTVRVGGLMHAYCSYPQHAPNTDWSGYSGWLGYDCSDTGSRVEMRVPGLTVNTDKEYVALTTSSDPWASWSPMEWDTMDGVDPGSVPDGRRISSGQCRNHPWNGKGVIDVTTNTVIDTTPECSNGLLLGDYGGLTINMSADLAIYAHYFYGNGNITINSTDGQPHSLYLIDPAPAGFTECPASVPSPSASNGGFKFSSGAWNQDPEIAILAYTAGMLESGRSDFHFGGQVYSCSANFTSGFYLDFRRVGDVSASDDFSNFEVNYIRRSG